MLTIGSPGGGRRGLLLSDLRKGILVDSLLDPGSIDSFALLLLLNILLELGGEEARTRLPIVRRANRATSLHHSRRRIPIQGPLPSVRLVLTLLGVEDGCVIASMILHDHCDIVLAPLRLRSLLFNASG